MTTTTLPATPQIPAVERARPLKLPAIEEGTLRNGLRVIAVRRATVPRVEARLRIPAGHVYDHGDGARARLVGETLTAGTRSRSAFDLAQELQRLGASLDAGGDVDYLHVHGGGLARSLGGLLDLMAEVVVEPAFSADEVAVARDRVAQDILIRRSQPAGIAAEATGRRVFGRHRYGRPLPSPDAVRRIGPAPLAAFHGERVLPKGSTLVLVGDLSPTKAIERAAEAFATWKRRPVADPVAPPPPIKTGVPTLIVDRPGSVQTSIRICGPGLPRRDPEYLALSLANLVYGGYFSSRLVKNIREDKGYTYSPAALVDHRRLASTVMTVADVGADVTAASLVEIRYELGRMAALGTPQGELDAARRYFAGISMLQVQSQGGLAAAIDAAVAAGLPADYLKGFNAQLDAVTAADASTVAERLFAPKGLITILVGDASRIRASVERLDDVEVISS
jgi:zinc protease